MYSLELHGDVISGAHSQFTGQPVHKIRVELTRVSGTPIYAYGATRIEYANYLLEQLTKGECQSLVDLVNHKVVIVRKDGTILTEDQVYKLSFGYTKTA